MPYIEKPTVKLYYSIGEVADMFGVNPSLIRFWEKEFDIIKPTKNKKGNRLFTDSDIQNFKKIFSLVKGEGYTLHGAKERLKDKSFKAPGDSPEADAAMVLEKLMRLKSELGQLKQLF
ncbi:MAG: MerR family transcriptional regulator [Bacteroidota bacterium]